MYTCTTYNVTTFVGAVWYPESIQPSYTTPTLNFSPLAATSTSFSEPLEGAALKCSKPVVLRARYSIECPTLNGWNWSLAFGEILLLKRKEPLWAPPNPVGTFGAWRAKPSACTFTVSFSNEMKSPLYLYVRGFESCWLEPIHAVLWLFI